ncbi:hypothetical protein HPP92_011310 [Vanilla planifolia]|uniref:GDSL esterase/lipase n=1 Tax=Vanilla planifolia TaxID=51239 RepID=A0A835R5T1_VANPL|nr:hypothetical protein HPP92_011310 [Vanilla planifolia]
MAHRIAFFVSFLVLHSPFRSSAAARTRIPTIIVFGDSTVDTGNNNGIKTILKSDFQPYGRDFDGGQPTGRFCNGRIATDFIAEALGLGSAVPAYLDPAHGIKDFTTAVCFASAGTGLDNATSDVMNVIPLWKELQYFKRYRMQLQQHLGPYGARRTISEALYVISIGTNDFLENYFLLITGRFKQFSVADYEDFLISLAADFVTEIYRLGARKVLLTELPPMGCLPLERTINFLGFGECNEKYNQVAREYNAKMEVMAADLLTALPGARLAINRIYGVVDNIIRNPSQFGFENVAEGCCGTGLFEMGYLCSQMNPHTCLDADKYVFWDSFHPTEKTYRLIVDFLINTTLWEFMR